MRHAMRIFVVALAGMSVAACSSGGDSTEGAGGTGASGGTAGSGGAAASGGTGGTNGGNTSSVSGVVYARDAAENPVAGVTVTVVGTQISTTTDQSGAFTLDDVPNGAQFFATEVTGYWGIVDYWDVPDETRFGADFGVIPEGDIAGIADALGRTLSPNDGGVDVTFYQGAVGGETASVSADSDPSFTFNLADEPVQQAGVIADNDGFGELIYTSIDTGDGPITATVTGAPGMTACFVDEDAGTTYPILAKAITIVYAYCEPAQ